MTDAFAPAAPPASPATPNVVIELGQEMLLIFIVTGLGYVLKSCGIVTQVTEAGIGQVVGLIAFPAVLFRAIATIDTSLISGPTSLLPLVFAALIAKVVIFVLSFAFGVLTARRAAPGAAMARGALLAIFATQSDDIGLGYPVLKAIFKAEAPILFVLSALQSLVLNPAAYVLLGFAKARAGEQHGGDAKKRHPLRTALGALSELRRNMLVWAVVAGLAYRLSLGPTLPATLDRGRILGSPFPPLVYLIGGFAAVGSFGSFTSLRAAGVPLALVGFKSLLLPILCRWLLWVFTAEAAPRAQLAFVFLYGLLPCANSALVIARMNGAAPPVFALLSAALSLNKAVAFLLLFVAAAFLMSPGTSQLLEVKDVFSDVMHVLSILGCVALLATAAFTPAWRRGAMRRVVILVALQLGFNLSFLVVRAVRGCFSHAQCGDDAHPGAHALEYSLVSFLRWAVDGWTVTIAVALAVGGRCGRWWGKAAHVAPLLDPSSGAPLQSTQCSAAAPAWPRRRPQPAAEASRRRRRSRSCSGWAGRCRLCCVSTRLGARRLSSTSGHRTGGPRDGLCGCVLGPRRPPRRRPPRFAPTTAPRTLLPKRAKHRAGRNAAADARRRRTARRTVAPAANHPCVARVVGRRAARVWVLSSRSLSTRAASPPRARGRRRARRRRSWPTS